MATNEKKTGGAAGRPLSFSQRRCHLGSLLLSAVDSSSEDDKGQRERERSLAEVFILESSYPAASTATFTSTAGSGRPRRRSGGGIGDERQEGTRDRSTVCGGGGAVEARGGAQAMVRVELLRLALERLVLRAATTKEAEAKGGTTRTRAKAAERRRRSGGGDGLRSASTNNGRGHDRDDNNNDDPIRCLACLVRSAGDESGGCGHSNSRRHGGAKDYSAEGLCAKYALCLHLMRRSGCLLSGEEVMSALPAVLEMAFLHGDGGGGGSSGASSEEVGGRSPAAPECSSEEDRRNDGIIVADLATAVGMKGDDDNGRGDVGTTSSRHRGELEDEEIRKAVIEDLALWTAVSLASVYRDNGSGRRIDGDDCPRDENQPGATPGVVESGASSPLRNVQWAGRIALLSLASSVYGGSASDAVNIDVRGLFLVGGGLEGLLLLSRDGLASDSNDGRRSSRPERLHDERQWQQQQQWLRRSSSNLLHLVPTRELFRLRTERRRRPTITIGGGGVGKKFGRQSLSLVLEFLRWRKERGGGGASAAVVNVDAALRGMIETRGGGCDGVYEFAGHSQGRRGRVSGSGGEERDSSGPGDDDLTQRLRDAERRAAAEDSVSSARQRMSHPNGAAATHGCGREYSGGEFGRTRVSVLATETRRIVLALSEGIDWDRLDGPRFVDEFIARGTRGGDAALDESGVSRPIESELQRRDRLAKEASREEAEREEAIRRRHEAEITRRRTRMREVRAARAAEAGGGMEWEREGRRWLAARKAWLAKADISEKLHKETDARRRERSFRKLMIRKQMEEREGAKEQAKQDAIKAQLDKEEKGNQLLWMMSEERKAMQHEDDRERARIGKEEERMERMERAEKAKENQRSKKLANFQRERDLSAKRINSGRWTKKEGVALYRDSL